MPETPEVRLFGRLRYNDQRPTTTSTKGSTSSNSSRIHRHREHPLSLPTSKCLLTSSCAALWQQPSDLSSLSNSVRVISNCPHMEAGSTHTDIHPVLTALLSRAIHSLTQPSAPLNIQLCLCSRWSCVTFLSSLLPFFPFLPPLPVPSLTLDVTNDAVLDNFGAFLFAGFCLAIYKGTVNDPTTFPPPQRSAGSHHWTFERLLSAGLVPLTAAAFVTSGSHAALLDGLLGISLVVHSHIGVRTLSFLFLHPYSFRLVAYPLYVRTILPSLIPSWWITSINASSPRSGQSLPGRYA